MAKSFEGSHFRDKLTLSDELRNAVKSQDWSQVDHLCASLITKDSPLFQRLYPYACQSRLEYIINVRDAKNPWEEDGIWHDDGSRVLAFTLGLNLNPNTIEGGDLLIRVKRSCDENIERISAPAFGDLIIFKTGLDNYEHKVEAVKKGHRVVMAGWCYK